MRALHPPSDAQLASQAADATLSARERALIEELEGLRAENAYLRGFYAQHLNGQTPVPPAAGADPAASPLPLPLATTPFRREGPASSGIAQLEYKAVFATLSSVFPVGIFRTDHTGVLTHVDEQLKTIFGLEAADFPHFGWIVRVHPEDQARVRKVWDDGVVSAREWWDPLESTCRHASLSIL